MTAINRQITLASRPRGFPRLSDFNLTYSRRPTPVDGEVLVRSIYLSLDPSSRMRMNAVGTGAVPIAIGGVMTGGVVGLVVESLDPAFRAGDTVEGMLGWQELAVGQGSELRRVDPEVAPISTALGVLGRPGLTAFFGLLDVCAPLRGETVVVSGAAGSVGMVVGQIARIAGCRVVGVAGSDAKIAWLLDELGLDAAFNYKSAECCNRKLAELCPDGIDVYFDNVGGTVTDAAVLHLNAKARIALCGQLSQLNLEEPGLGPRWLAELIVKQAKLEGFLVSAYAQRFPEGREQLTRWLQQGQLKYREEVAQGIESAPKAFIEMLEGRNQGKQLVQMSDTGTAG